MTGKTFHLLVSETAKETLMSGWTKINQDMECRFCVTHSYIYCNIVIKFAMFPQKLVDYETVKRFASVKVNKMLIEVYNFDLDALVQELKQFENVSCYFAVIEPGAAPKRVRISDLKTIKSGFRLLHDVMQLCDQKENKFSEIEFSFRKEPNENL